MVDAFRRFLKCLCARGAELRRIEAERTAYQRSEAVLAQAGEMALLGAWWIDVLNPHDINSNALNWSDETYRIFGYEPGRVHVTNELFFARVHPEDRAKVAKAFAAAIAECCPYSIEHRILRTDGTERIVLEHAQVAYDAAGRRPLRIVGAVQDLTDHKRNEEALRQTAERLSRAQEAGHVGVFDWDLATDHVYCTPELYEIFGIAPCAPEINLRCWASLVHPEDLPAVQALLNEWIAGTEDEKRWEYRFFRRGEERWMVSRGRILRDASGRPVRIVGTDVDITERKQAEEALRAADRRKNEFLAMLSHELRNPLAPIRNGLAILERAPAGSEPAKRAQRVIERQVGHMARLIDDLVDVTRISRGNFHIDREPLDLGEVVLRAAEDYRPMFAKKGIELEVTVTGAPMRAEGDPTRLAQVVGNLLQNAVRFTPPGGRTLLSLSRSDTLVAEIVVRDTGAGIPPEIMTRLFEPFMQATQPIDRSRGGLGLGLTLVKRLVELHGGQVSASSNGPGAGAEFRVQLPVEASRAEVAREAASTVAPEEKPGSRVLVIEDNVDAAETLKDALEFYRHVVEVAFTGAEGLAKARTFHPDVVLCDIGLPEMDGYEVAKRMRSDPDLASIHLVALSGYALPEDLERSRLAGFEDHVVKPPSLEALEERLARIAG